LLADPGERWDYGINVDWAGKMVEAVSGQKLDTYFQQNIFGPLGMTDTSFKLSPSQRARLSSMHARTTKGHWRPSSSGCPRSPSSSWGAAASTAPPATTSPSRR
jgi:CubicO group peptidase (beta-lactamase class C family)